MYDKWAEQSVAGSHWLVRHQRGPSLLGCHGPVRFLWNCEELNWSNPHLQLVLWSWKGNVLPNYWGGEGDSVHPGDGEPGAWECGPWTRAMNYFAYYKIYKKEKETQRERNFARKHPWLLRLCWCLVLCHFRQWIHYRFLDWSAYQPHCVAMTGLFCFLSSPCLFMIEFSSSVFYMSHFYSGSGTF